MTEAKGIEQLKSGQVQPGGVVRSLKQMAFVLSLGGLFVLSTSVAIYLAMRQPQVETPRLIGLSLPQAQEMARRLGLELEVKTRRYDDRYPADAVVDQWPPSGMTIKRGQAVRVILSQGRRPGPAEAVAMPVETKPTPAPSAETAPPPAQAVTHAPPPPAEPAVTIEAKPSTEETGKAEERREPVPTVPPSAAPAAKQPETNPEKPSAPPVETTSPAKRPGKQGERRPGSHG